MNRCQKCNKEFSSKQRINYHITRKVCEKTNKRCEKCDHLFKTKAMLKYHLENNVCQKNIQNQLDPNKNDIGIDHISKRDLYEENLRLNGQLIALKENPQMKIEKQQINVIFPTTYGQEDINHICRKLGDILHPLVSKKPFQSIPCLFEKIHKNKELPEYHNVYTTSEKSSYALVSDGVRFCNRPKKSVIDQIIEDKCSILNEYIDSNGQQLGEKVLEKYEKYQEKLDSDPVFRRNLELEIGGMLLDMKAIIADDEKTRRLLEKVNLGNFELDDRDK